MSLMSWLQALNVMTSEDVFCCLTVFVRLSVKVKFPPVSTKYCVSGHFRQSIIIITVIVYTTFTESQL